MAEAISDTSAMFYLHQIGRFGWLGQLFTDVWVPTAVVAELEAGSRNGHDVPALTSFPWIHVAPPAQLPSLFGNVDLGPGELAVLGLALANPRRIVILDDAPARSVAHSSGLTVWGTLRVVLEAKRRGLTPSVQPILESLRTKGMWISDELAAEVLGLANEVGGSRG